MVTVMGLLVDATPVRGKFTSAGVIWIAPFNPPVPLSETVARVVSFDADTVSVPVSRPRDWGVNTTPVVQLAPGARLVPQWFWEKLKGPEAASVRPEALMPSIFETVTVWAALG